MTKSEMTAAIIDSQRRFYAWEPPGNPFANFRCWHIEPFPAMNETQCKARAGKLELFRNAGCSNRCPRWRHYRKEFEKIQRDDGLMRRAYK